MKIKKIIILMYNFPPLGAGRGLAWSMFSDTLSEKYDVTVITSSPFISDPNYNENKLSLISGNYEILRLPPDFIYKKIYSTSEKQISGNIKIRKSFLSRIFIKKKEIFNFFRSFIFPDRMLLWSWNASKTAKSLNPDVVISVGFPFSTHLTTSLIFKKSKSTKVIFDYGDPWSLNPSSETVPKYRKAIDYIAEKFSLKIANRIIVTTKNTAQAYSETFNINSKIVIIRQGVDLKNYTFLGTKEKKSRITLAYTGIFYKDIRNPQTFFEAISEINKFEFPITIKIIGYIQQEYVDTWNKFKNNVDIQVDFTGPIDFDKAIQEQLNCDGLLYFGNLGGLQVPGKIYEYIAARRPIFSILSNKSEEKELINESYRGEVTSYDKEEIKIAFEVFIKNLIRIRNGENIYDLCEIKNIDWEFKKKQIEEVIEGVLNE